MKRNKTIIAFILIAGIMALLLSGCNENKGSEKAAAQMARRWK